MGSLFTPPGLPRWTREGQLQRRGDGRRDEDAPAAAAGGGGGGGGGELFADDVSLSPSSLVPVSSAASTDELSCVRPTQRRNPIGLPIVRSLTDNRRTVKGALLDEDGSENDCSDDDDLSLVGRIAALQIRIRRLEVLVDAHLVRAREERENPTNEGISYNASVAATFSASTTASTTSTNQTVANSHNVDVLQKDLLPFKYSPHKKQNKFKARPTPPHPVTPSHARTEAVWSEAQGAFVFPQSLAWCCFSCGRLFAHKKAVDSHIRCAHNPNSAGRKTDNASGKVAGLNSDPGISAMIMSGNTADFSSPSASPSKKKRRLANKQKYEGVLQASPESGGQADVSTSPSPTCVPVAPAVSNVPTVSTGKPPYRETKQDLLSATRNSKIISILNPLTDSPTVTDAVVIEDINDLAAVLGAEVEIAERFDDMRVRVFAPTCQLCSLPCRTSAEVAMHRESSSHRKRRERLVREYDEVLSTRFESLDVLLDTVFYVIDFEAAATLAGGEPLPVEIGICAFKLRDNITPEISRRPHRFEEIAAFHALINPGSVPREAIPQVRYVEKRVHGIKLKFAQNQSVSYSQLWEDILNFVGGHHINLRSNTLVVGDRAGQSDCSSRRRIVIAKGKNMEERCLIWLAQRVAEESSSQPVLGNSSLPLLPAGKHGKAEAANVQRRRSGARSAHKGINSTAARAIARDGLAVVEADSVLQSIHKLLHDDLHCPTSELRDHVWEPLQAMAHLPHAPPASPSSRGSSQELVARKCAYHVPRKVEFHCALGDVRAIAQRLCEAFRAFDVHGPSRAREDWWDKRRMEAGLPPRSSSSSPAAVSGANSRWTSKRHTNSSPHANLSPSPGGRASQRPSISSETAKQNAGALVLDTESAPLARQLQYDD